MSLSSFLARSVKEKEQWKYTDLQTLLKQRPTLALVHTPPPQRQVSTLAHSARDTDQSSDQETARFVFVNGHWQGKQSTFGQVPSCILMGDLQSGYELILGEHTCLVAQPIELVFDTDGQCPSELALKLSITVGDNGRLTLLERHLTSSCVTAVETKVTLHPRAKFVHGKIVQNNTHLSLTEVSVAHGAYYNNFSLLKGGVPARNEIDVCLQGSEAQVALNGVMLLRDQQHADTSTRIKHQAPNCASRQTYKTVVDGKAHGVFQGKIIVAQDAQKTDGYQLSRALLLSDQAEMNAKPELEIYADDVKCSHGSTIGDLNENALFYLRARGLNEAEARALLIEAFVAESLDEIQINEWRPVFAREIERWSK